MSACSRFRGKSGEIVRKAFRNYLRKLLPTRVLPSRRACNDACDLADILPFRKLETEFNLSSTYFQLKENACSRKANSRLDGDEIIIWTWDNLYDCTQCSRMMQWVGKRNKERSFVFSMEIFLDLIFFFFHWSGKTLWVSFAMFTTPPPTPRCLARTVCYRNELIQTLNDVLVNLSPTSITSSQSIVQRKRNFSKMFQGENSPWMAELKMHKADKSFMMLLPSMRLPRKWKFFFVLLSFDNYFWMLFKRSDIRQNRFYWNLFLFQFKTCWREWWSRSRQSMNFNFISLKWKFWRSSKNCNSLQTL